LCASWLAELNVRVPGTREPHITDPSSSDRTTPENGIHIKAKEMVQRLDEEFSRFPRIEPAYTTVKRRVQRVVDDPRVRTAYETEVKPRVRAAVTRLEGVELFTLRVFVALLYQLESVLDGMLHRFGESAPASHAAQQSSGAGAEPDECSPVSAADSLDTAIRKLRARACRVRVQVVELLNASVAGARRVGDQAGTFLADERTVLYRYAKSLVVRLLSMLRSLADYGLNALGKEYTPVSVPVPPGQSGAAEASQASGVL